MKTLVRFFYSDGSFEERRPFQSCIGMSKIVDGQFTRPLSAELIAVDDFNALPKFVWLNIKQWLFREALHVMNTGDFKDKFEKYLIEQTKEKQNELEKRD